MTIRYKHDQSEWPKQEVFHSFNPDFTSNDHYFLVIVINILFSIWPNTLLLSLAVEETSRHDSCYEGKCQSPRFSHFSSSQLERSFGSLLTCCRGNGFFWGGGGFRSSSWSGKSSFPSIHRLTCISKSFIILKLRMFTNPQQAFFHQHIWNNVIVFLSLMQLWPVTCFGVRAANRRYYWETTEYYHISSITE